jgi:hypothetical protein
VDNEDYAESTVNQVINALRYLYVELYQRPMALGDIPRPRKEQKLPETTKQRSKTMKLLIKRDQKAQAGMFGGHKGMSFVLSYRVELTPEEKALVEKYKAGYHPLTFTTDRDGTQLP